MRRLLLTLATLICAFVPTATAGAATYNATPSTFSSVFASARAGDTILLASGNYGKFTGGMKSGEVTIKEADGASATMSLDFRPASYITIDGLDIPSSHMADSRTKNITVRNSTFDGARSRAVFRAESGGLVNANVLFEKNRHLNAYVCSGCWAARVHISGRTSEPTGITIRDSLFQHGDADGIQNGGNAVQIIGNTFRDICQGCTSSGAHTDSIQLYGSKGTVIRRNFFYNVDMGNPGAYDRLDHEVIEDNVVVSSDYPFQTQLLSDNGSIVRHNTFVERAVDGTSSSSGCSYNLMCGIVRMGNKSHDPPSTGTVLKDNILSELSIDGTYPSFAENDYNLYTHRKGAGTNSILADPVYVGGAKPTTYEGFALAAGSPGKGAASDGTDMGARIGTTEPAPEPEPEPGPAPTASYTYSPSSPTTGQEVTFDGSGSTCPSTPCTYRWEDDGSDGPGGDQWPLGSGQTLKFTFSSPGDKHVRLTVTGSDGRSDAWVRTVTVSEPTSADPVWVGGFEWETANVAGWFGVTNPAEVVNDPHSSMSKWLRFFWYGTASKTLSTSRPMDRIEVSARGKHCLNSSGDSMPKLRLKLDGTEVGMQDVTNTDDWAIYRFDVPPVAAGEHTIAIDYPNHHESAECRRELHLDYVNGWDR